MSTPDPGSESLVRRAKEGDAEAWEGIFFRLNDLLERSVRAHPLWPLLKRGFEADDIVQDVFLAVTSGSLERFEYRGPRSLEGWFGGVLDNKMKNLAHRVTADKRGGGVFPQRLRGSGDTSSSHLGEQPVAPDPSPSEFCHAEELRAEILGALDGTQRQIWILFALEGLNFNEIAERLELKSESAARGHYHRAQKFLRNLPEFGEGSA